MIKPRNPQSVIPRFILSAGLVAMMVMTTASFAQNVAPPPKKSSTVRAVEMQLENAIGNLNILKDQISRSADRIIKLTVEREAFFKKQDSLGISYDSFADVLKMLQAQRVELMIDLAGMEARRDSLSSIQNQDVVDQGDPAVLELYGKLVELQTKKFDRAKKLHATGSMGVLDMDSAQIELLNAKLQLANAKNAPKVSPRINEELLTVSLDRAEKRARLIKIETLLKTFTDSRMSLLETEDLADKIGSERSRRDKIESEMRVLDSRIQSLEIQLKQVSDADL